MASLTKAFSEGISLTWTNFGRFALAGILLLIVEFVYVFNDAFYEALIARGGDPIGFLALSYATDFVFLVAIGALGVWVYTTAFRLLRSSDEPVFTGGRVGWTVLYQLIVIVLLLILVFAAFFIIGASAAATFILASAGSIIGAALIGMLSFVLLIGSAIMMTYFSVRLFTFPVLSIADASIDPFKAIGISWRMTHGNVLRLIGLSFMLGLLNFAGLIALGIGLIFTIPASLVVMAHFYEQIRTSRA